MSRPLLVDMSTNLRLWPGNWRTSQGAKEPLGRLPYQLQWFISNWMLAVHPRVLARPQQSPIGPKRCLPTSKALIPIILLLSVTRASTTSLAHLLILTSEIVLPILVGTPT